MDFFNNTHKPNNEYLKKYITTASRFQNIGIAVILCAVILNYFGSSSIKTLSLFIFFGGAISLIIGGSSLRPHNLIKSFAQQCSREPNDIIADGLLEAIERNHKTALTKNSLNSVYIAIDVYATLPEADKELALKLRNAAETCLVKKNF